MARSTGDGAYLARWTARTGPGERIVTTKTLRRRFFSRAGRITRPARRLTLHLPKRWPWQEKVTRAPARLRAIPLPACRRPSATVPTSGQLNVPANSRHPGPRAPLAVPVPPFRSPQPLQAAAGAPKSACRPPANLPPTRIRARIIAPITPLPPSTVLAPSIGGFGLSDDRGTRRRIYCGRVGPPIAKVSSPGGRGLGWGRILRTCSTLASSPPRRKLLWLPPPGLCRL